MPLLGPGHRVAGLRVDALLSVGATSELYRLRDRASERTFALRIQARGDATALHREQVALQALTGLGFLVPESLYIIAGRPALLLQWPGGPLLPTWVAIASPTAPERAAIAQRVVQAIAHAHDAGWTHRDLSPSRVTLERGSRGWAPVMTGLGLATHGFGPVVVAPETTAFTAPERLGGDAGDARSDVFSLGAITRWLITGQASTAPSQAPALAAPLAALLDQCQHADPDVRPPDASALALALALAVPTAAIDVQSGMEHDTWETPTTLATQDTWARSHHTLSRSVGDDSLEELTNQAVAIATGSPQSDGLPPSEIPDAPQRPLRLGPKPYTQTRSRLLLSLIVITVIGVLTGLFLAT